MQLVASKFLHDDGEEDEVFNEEWATSAGMEKKDLNKLEIDFLMNIDWNCYISNQEFQNMAEKLENSITTRQINTRPGRWTTYTDIDILSKRISLYLVWERMANLVLKVTAVCVAAYAASLMTMIGPCYALTRVNLGPSTVSQSLNTLLSATTSTATSKTSTTNANGPTNSSSSSVVKSDHHLSHMDSVTLEQLSSEVEVDALISAAEEELTEIIANFEQPSLTRSRESWCQQARRQASLSVHSCRHCKGKPPNSGGLKSVRMISPDNNGLMVMRKNGTCQHDNNSVEQVLSLVSWPNDSHEEQRQNENGGDSQVPSIPSFSSFFTSWKMDHFLPPSWDGLDSSTKTCQNSLQLTTGLSGMLNFRQSHVLIDHLGKSMWIGLGMV